MQLVFKQPLYQQLSALPELLEVLCSCLDLRGVQVLVDACFGRVSFLVGGAVYLEAQQMQAVVKCSFEVVLNVVNDALFILACECLVLDLAQFNHIFQMAGDGT